MTSKHHFLFDQSLESGLYHCPQENWPMLAEAAKNRGSAVLCGSIRGSDLRSALSQLAADLHFPVWFGNNLDALHDILTDPAWHQQRPQMVCLNEIPEPAKLPPEAMEELLEVLDSAVKIRRQEGSPLWVVFGFDAPSVPEISCP